MACAYIIVYYIKATTFINIRVTVHTCMHACMQALLIKEEVSYSTIVPETALVRGHESLTLLLLLYLCN